jgi:hypothetical protein
MERRCATADCPDTGHPAGASLSLQIDAGTHRVLFEAKVAAAILAYS